MDPRASELAIGFSAVVLLLAPALWAKDVLFELPFLTILLVSAALTGTLTIRRVAFISYIVSTGVEADARVLESRSGSGFWRGSHVTRTRLSYESDGEKLEGRATMWRRGKSSLSGGEHLALLVDPRQPEHFILRDLFLESEPERQGAKPFPVSSETLWPNGRLIQLQHLTGDTMIFTRRTVVILTEERLIIAEEEDPEEDSEPMTDEEFLYKKGYEFYDGSLAEVNSYAVGRIAKVNLSSSVLREPMSIWAADESGRICKAIKADAIWIPRTFFELTHEAAKQHAFPEMPESWDEGKVSTLAMQLLVRELEKQFRRVAPQAEIEIKGSVMSEENFRRIIK